MEDFSWLLRPFQRPSRRFEPTTHPKPEEKAYKETTGPAPVVGARTDSELRAAVSGDRGETVCVFYGSSYCRHCERLFPIFVESTKALAGKGPNTTKFVVAQVDYMREEVKHLKFTPVFEAFRGGARVDQYLARDPQILRDRVWLWGSG